MEMFEDIEQHEFNPSRHSPHTKIIRYVPSNTIVLDVGCNWGYLGRELKNKNCRIFGIDMDKDAAQKARRFYEQVITGDVETINNLPFPENYFDAIIFSDILEHLERPDLVLASFKQYLKPSGFIIASIPNIARLEYRIKHLLGNFDYEPYGGILSRTHLRFFTLKTAKRLFEDAGYEIIDIDYTGLASKLKIFAKLLAFQFVIVAKKIF